MVRRSRLVRAVGTVMSLSALTACSAGVVSNACSPFVSCEAVLDVYFDRVFSSEEINSQCERWNSLTLGEQDRFVEQLVNEPGVLGDPQELRIFEDPVQATTGLVTEFVNVLSERC